MADHHPSILWLYSDKSGCGTYRCYIPALSLDVSHGGPFDNHFLSQFDCRSTASLDPVEDVSIVVFQRAVGRRFEQLARTCRERQIRVVFELDDDLFHIPRFNPSAWFWGQKAVQKSLLTLLHMADGVTVSTPELRDVVAHRTGRSDIVVCPNHLHPAVWGADLIGDRVFPNGDKIVIGWQGSSTHDQDYQQAIPALQHILDRYPHVILRFLGSVPATIQGKIAENRFQWSRGVPFERYPSTLRYVNFTIGIAPLTTNRFNHSKSNVKVLEYMACGIPAVASSLPAYQRTIRHGDTGFLAASTKEWVDVLTSLIEDPDLRRRIVDQATSEVWRMWGPHHATAWRDLFCRLVSMNQEVGTC